MGIIDKKLKDLTLDIDVAILEGRAFTFTDDGAFPSAGTVEYVFTPQFNTAICSFNINTDTTDFITAIYEDTVASGGADVKAQLWQLNRVKPVVATATTIVKDPTVSVAGTKVFEARTLTDVIKQGNVVGNANTFIPFILKADTVYRFEFTNQIASAEILIVQFTGMIV